jgi:hypothetical protein
MSSKFWIFAGLTVGSYLGSYLPTLWGASFLSFSSAICGFIGGALGIWAGLKISQSFS